MSANDLGSPFPHAPDSPPNIPLRHRFKVVVVPPPSSPADSTTSTREGDETFRLMDASQNLQNVMGYVSSPTGMAAGGHVVTYAGSSAGSNPTVTYAGSSAGVHAGTYAGLFAGVHAGVHVGTYAGSSAGVHGGVHGGIYAGSSAAFNPTGLSPVGFDPAGFDPAGFDTASLDSAEFAPDMPAQGVTNMTAHVQPHFSESLSYQYENLNDFHEGDVTDSETSEASEASEISEVSWGVNGIHLDGNIEMFPGFTLNDHQNITAGLTMADFVCPRDLADCVPSCPHSHLDENRQLRRPVRQTTTPSTDAMEFSATVSGEVQPTEAELDDENKENIAPDVLMANN